MKSCSRKLANHHQSCRILKMKIIIIIIIKKSDLLRAIHTIPWLCRLCHGAKDIPDWEMYHDSWWGISAEVPDFNSYLLASHQFYPLLLSSCSFLRLPASHSECKPTPSTSAIASPSLSVLASLACDLTVTPSLDSYWFLLLAVWMGKPEIFLEIKK